MAPRNLPTDLLRTEVAAQALGRRPGGRRENRGVDNRRATLITLVSALLLASCEQRPSAGKTTDTVRTATRTAAALGADVTATSQPKTAAALDSASKEQDEPSEQLVSPSRKRQAAFKLGAATLVLDELVDVAPAGPSAATPAGVLLLLRDSRPIFAPLDTETNRRPRTQKTPLTPIEIESGALVAREHGPVVTGGYAYFVHGGHLVRRRLPNGELENLADDARQYTRVAVPDLPHANLPAVIGYIARHPTERDTLLAKLWIDGQPTQQLTPDGSAGNSVTISRTNGGYVAISLESRTGMSPLHARRIGFEQGKVKLGPDVVPWVAGTAQPMTEVYSVSDLNDLWALVPIERDSTRFGLARIDIGSEPRMSAPLHWREYPNGLEPAVVAIGHLCERPVVLYARPATAEPHATQELHLAGIGEDGLGPSTIIATSRGFADASFAGLDEGALVVYVADRRTWARRLRCVPG